MGRTSSTKVENMNEEEKNIVSYFPKCTYKGNSLVDALKSIKVASDYKTRQTIAKANGILNYRGSAANNTKLLDLLKKGKLIKP